MHTPITAQIRAEQVSLTPRLLVSGQGARDVVSTPVHYLLKDLSFDVFQGDRIALVGASGAGKTSLLRLLNRLSEPTSGTIYLDGRAINLLPAMLLRQQVVLVLQETKLLGMTVRQALEYPLTLRQLSKQTIQARIEQWSEQLHLPSEWMHRTELQLSVGQRQVVAIARALVTEPNVLLLDEPTSSLDVGRNALLLKALTELAQKRGTTILMANHQLELAEQFCDRVFFLEHGRLQQDSSVQQMDWAMLKQRVADTEAHQTAEWS